MQLRKICQHPFLFESVEDKLNPAGLIDDKLIRSSGKIELLNRILPKFFDQGHRVRLPSLSPSPLPTPSNSYTNAAVRRCSSSSK